MADPQDVPLSAAQRSKIRRLSQPREPQPGEEAGELNIIPYLDIIKSLHDTTDVPIAAYQVSGEYAMIHAAARNGWIDLDAAMRESLMAIRRAGATIIITYFAKALAEKR